MKRWIITIIFLSLITLVTAQVGEQFPQCSDQPIKIGQCVNIRQSCSNCTIVNISYITYPNSTIANSFSVMTQNSGYWNKTFCSNDINGVYTVVGSGDPDSFNEPWGCVYEVSINGAKTDTSRTIGYLIALIVSIGLFIFFFYASLVLPWSDKVNEEGWIVGVNELKYVKLIMWFLTYLSLMFITTIAHEITGSLLLMVGASNFFNAMFTFLFILAFPLFVALFIVGAIALIEGKKTKELINRGIGVHSKDG